MARKPQQNPADIAKTASKLGELKVRFLFLIGALIVFRAGTYIPVPGVDPVALALHGGEDFELLFVVPGSKTALLEKEYPRDLPPITRIGKITRGKGKIWTRNDGKKRRRLTGRGYDHFRR